MFLTKFPKWKSPTCKTFSAIIVTAASEATSLASFCWGNRVCRRVKPSQTPHRTLVFYVSLMCDAFNAAAALLCAATLVSSCLTDDFLQTSSFSPRVWIILWGKPLWKLLIQLLWLTRHRIGQQQKIYKKNGMEFELKNVLLTTQWIQRKERKKGRKRRDEKTVLFSYISVPTVLALIPSPSTWKWRLGHYYTKVK